MNSLCPIFKSRSLATIPFCVPTSGNVLGIRLEDSFTKTKWVRDSSFLSPLMSLWPPWPLMSCCHSIQCSPVSVLTCRGHAISLWLLLRLCSHYLFPEALLRCVRTWMFWGLFNLGLAHLLESLGLYLSPHLGAFSAIYFSDHPSLSQDLGLWMLEICLLFTVSEALPMCFCLCSLLFRTEKFLCSVLSSWTLCSRICTLLWPLSSKFVKFLLLCFSILRFPPDSSLQLLFLP